MIYLFFSKNQSRGTRTFAMALDWVNSLKSGLQYRLITSYGARYVRIEYNLLVLTAQYVPGA